MDDGKSNVIAFRPRVSVMSGKEYARRMDAIFDRYERIERAFLRSTHRQWEAELDALDRTYGKRGE
jgi:hypothetical protein